MIRIEPSLKYDNIPCSIVACGCALDKIRGIPTGQSLWDTKSVADTLPYKNDGYLTLQGANKLIRSLFKVKRGGYHYFKRGERHTLSSFDFTGKRAIVIVYGHYIYVQNDEYYSFFNNENDLVVAIWEIEGEKWVSS